MSRHAPSRSTEQMPPGATVASMLVAQIAMGVLGLACALMALAVMYMAEDQRVAIISLLVLAVFFAVLMVWAGFLPDHEVIP